MTSDGIARLRLLALSIARPDRASTGELSCAEMVSHLGAMQAQDHAGALWALGLRCDSARTDVERALDAGAVVRTWPMRGTLHMVPAADVRWMLRLMTPRVISGAAARYRQLDLTPADFGRGRDIVTSALEGGAALTRAELYDALERGGVDPTGQRGVHVLSRLAMEAVLCFGPARAGRPTFVLLDEWVTTRHDLTADEALRTLAERYFRSHGPATAHDFARWTGLPVRDARTGIAGAGEALRAMTVDGDEYWLDAQLAAQRAPSAPGQAFLLPGFDEYMLGYKDRSASLAPQFSTRICPGGNGVFRATLVLDGQVCGTWKAVRTAGSITLSAEPFLPLSLAQREAFDVPAAAYARFTGTPVGVSWQPA